jgi:hypothetical protein
VLHPTYLPPQDFDRGVNGPEVTKALLLYSAWIINTAYILVALNDASRPTSLDSANATIDLFQKCVKQCTEDYEHDKDYIIEAALLLYVATRKFSFVDHVVGGHFDNVGHDDKGKFPLIENKIALAIKLEDKDVLNMRDNLPPYPSNKYSLPLPGVLYYLKYHLGTTLPSAECGKMECCCLDEVLHAGADVEFWLEKWVKKHGIPWDKKRQPHTIPSNLHRPIWVERKKNGKKQLELHFFSTAMLDWPGKRW